VKGHDQRSRTSKNIRDLIENWLNNLGPVGPHEPILVSLGNQRIVAFFVPERGECAVSAVTWKDAGPDALTVRPECVLP
jgi:hypothetical protein